MKNDMQVNPEDVSLEMIIEIFALWDKMYPDRLSPGEICEMGHDLYDFDEDNLETPIQKKIRKTVTYNKGYHEYINYRKNPEKAPKKYYSDGVAIDWNNIFMSNLAYNKRCEQDEFKLPGIDKAVTLYFHIKEN